MTNQDRIADRQTDSLHYFAYNEQFTALQLCSLHVYKTKIKLNYIKSIIAFT